MLKHFIAGFPLVLVLILASPAMGQTMPSGKWWKDPDIVKQLNLSSGEIKKLDKLFVKSRRKMIDLSNRVEKEKFEYETLMESPNLDESAVTRQLKKLEAARSDLNEERSRFVLGIRKILGRDRFQKLKEIYASQ